MFYDNQERGFGMRTKLLENFPTTRRFVLGPRPAAYSPAWLIMNVAESSKNRRSNGTTAAGSGVSANAFSINEIHRSRAA